VVHGRWRMLLTVVVAGAVASVLYAVFEAIDEDSPAPVTHYSHVLGQLDNGRFPTAIGIAVVAAVVTASAPWLSRRWRRLGWVLVVGLVITYFLGSPVSFDSLKAVLDGWFSGAVALVILGAPTRRPTPDAVREGLAGVGLPMAELEVASVDARGSTP